MPRIHIAVLIRAQAALKHFAQDLEDPITANTYADSAERLRRAINDLDVEATQITLSGDIPQGMS